MTTDQKIAEILSQIWSRNTNEVFSLLPYCDRLGCGGVELREIVKRLELEGYVKSENNRYSFTGGHSYGDVTITMSGQMVGRHNMYLEVKEIERSRLEQETRKDKAESRGKNIDRSITAFSVLSVAIIGIWSNLLNQDIKDAKASVDSLRIDIRQLRKDVQAGALSVKKVALPSGNPAKSTLDSSRLVDPKKE